MKLLFVCSRNKWRSPTAETILRRTPGIAVRSAGTSKKARRVLSANDVRWADVIFAMEQKHKKRMLSEFRQELHSKELHVLDIPDEYQYMDEELIAILLDKVDTYIDPTID